MEAACLARPDAVSAATPTLPPASLASKDTTPTQLEDARCAQPTA